MFDIFLIRLNSRKKNRKVDKNRFDLDTNDFRLYLQKVNKILLLCIGH